LRWRHFIIWSARSEVKKKNKENALITTVTSKSGQFKNKQHSFSTRYCSAPTTEVICGCFLCYYSGPKKSLVAKRKEIKTFWWEINILLSKRMNLVRVFIYHSIMTMISSYKLKVPKNQMRNEPLIGYRVQFNNKLSLTFVVLYKANQIDLTPIEILCMGYYWPQ
jgi:hypothetical protein